jgi:hypothetical protein
MNTDFNTPQLGGTTILPALTSTWTVSHCSNGKRFASPDCRIQWQSLAADSLMNLRAIEAPPGPVAKAAVEFRWR